MPGLETEKVSVRHCEDFKSDCVNIRGKKHFRKCNTYLRNGHPQAGGEDDHPEEGLGHAGAGGGGPGYGEGVKIEPELADVGPARADLGGAAAAAGLGAAAVGAAEVGAVLAGGAAAAEGDCSTNREISG